MEVAQLLVAIVGLAGVGFGIWSGLKQLNHTTAVARSSFLLQLDNAFVRHEEAKRNLRPGGKWWKEGVHKEDRDAWILIEAYMGLFERVQVMIEDGVVDLQGFDDLYGYLLVNIVDNTSIREAKLESNLAPYWQRFIDLCEAAQDNGREFTADVKGTRIVRAERFR